MTTKHKRVLAEAKKLVADYVRSVRKLERFKSKYCRAGDKIGNSGNIYGNEKHYRNLGHIVSPNRVVIERPEDKKWWSRYPLISAIREDIEK